MIPFQILEGPEFGEITVQVRAHGCCQGMGIVFIIGGSSQFGLAVYGAVAGKEGINSRQSNIYRNRCTH